MSENMNHELDMEHDNIVELIDEEGNEVDFEHLMTLEYEGHNYICLVPVEPMEDVAEDELVILRIETDEEGNDMYATIEFTSHTGSKVSWTVPASQMEQDVVVCVDQMVVADGRMPVTVTVYNADGTVHATATDSMESYIARMSSQHAVYEMILKFSDSAYNYFHKN